MITLADVSAEASRLLHEKHIPSGSVSIRGQLRTDLLFTEGWETRYTLDEFSARFLDRPLKALAMCLPADVARPLVVIADAKPVADPITPGDVMVSVAVGL